MHIMKIIKYYYLEYCRNCSYIDKKLKEENIEVEKINAEDESIIDEIEKIEAILQSSIYPILAIYENNKLISYIGYNLKLDSVGNVKIYSYITATELINILKTKL